MSIIYKRGIALSCWLVYSAMLARAATPVVDSAILNSTTQQVTITGTSLTSPANASPVVTLDGSALKLVSFSSATITATLPAGLQPGSYRLSVNNGTATGLLGVTYGLGTLTLPFAQSVASYFGPAFYVANTYQGTAAIRGDGGFDGGVGVAAYGGASDVFSTGGDAVLAQGGVPFSGSRGGRGVNAYGGGAANAQYGGTGVVATGGEAGVYAGDAIRAFGGKGLAPGDGIYAEAGVPGGPHNPPQGSVFAVNNFNYAGYFNGDVHVAGKISKAGGSFQIDHPLDPANKYLYHSFVESPDMMNIYNGNTITDGSGTAVVTLPDWFEALNSDFRYQLTPIGQHASAWIGDEISNRMFVIKTDRSNVKVSWQVTGIRQDAWANANRIQVEVDKAPADQGHYLHPDLFGHKDEPNIGQRHHPRPEPAQQ
jgi:hypothetical protein